MVWHMMRCEFLTNCTALRCLNLSPTTYRRKTEDVRSTQGFQQTEQSLATIDNIEGVIKSLRKKREDSEAVEKEKAAAMAKAQKAMDNDDGSEIDDEKEYSEDTMPSTDDEGDDGDAES